MLDFVVFQNTISYVKGNKEMTESDFENRKNNRRQNIQKKTLDRRSSDVDYRDINKLKKQFKKHKEEIRQEELWEDWEDEIR